MKEKTMHQKFTSVMTPEHHITMTHKEIQKALIVGLLKQHPNLKANELMGVVNAHLGTPHATRQQIAAHIAWKTIKG